MSGTLCAPNENEKNIWIGETIVFGEGDPIQYNRYHGTGFAGDSMVLQTSR
jgi:hypothetical protein